MVMNKLLIVLNTVLNKNIKMGESWALLAIKEGKIQLSNTVYDIIPSKSSSCNGCCFAGSQCPSKAIIICTTGGNILKPASNEK